jgi:NTE family protein
MRKAKLSISFPEHRAPVRIAVLLFFLYLPVFSINSTAQAGTATRPKIGYVLSGGGAKGMAHVGVLKVLEEVGLKPDVITGTSMGSIMGGLYSMGYSAGEIGHIIGTVDWGKVLTNEIPADQVIMRRKHEYRRFLLEMPIYEGKPELPSGLIEGQKLSELFSELSWRQAGVDNFSEFPVPFTCIATDILTGEMVEINSGDLSSAMRASMAIPSVFTAVSRDTSHILVDGGVRRNFPVQEALDMGADIIIGVYVGFDSQMEPEQLRSLTSVITRTSLLSGAQDVESQVPLVDYMIVPDLQGYSPASFTDGVEIMNRGETAARSQIEQLRALADSINGLGVPGLNEVLPANDSLLISDISVLYTTESLSSFVIEKSDIQTGSWITPDELNASIDRLFGTLFFEKIEYYFEKMEEGYRLVFRIKEKAHSSLKMALHYDNAFGPGVILNYTLLNSILDGSRLGLSVDISESPQFRAYYDIHLGKKRNFIGTLFTTSEREELPFYENNADIGNYKHTYFSGGLGFRQSLGINNHVGADIYYRYGTLKLSNNIKVVKPELEYLNNFIFRGPEVALVYRHNSYDSFLYPTRGSNVNLKYKQAFRTTNVISFSFPDSIEVDDRIKDTMDPYWHLTADLENYLPLGNKVSLNSGIAAGLSSDEKPFSDSYYIGGHGYNLRANQIAFMGLQNHELLVGNYLMGKLGLQLEPFPNLYASVLANLIFVADELDTFMENVLSFAAEGRYLGMGAGITYKTPVGPISVFYGSRTDVWNPIWYTSIGFTF